MISPKKIHRRLLAATILLASQPGVAVTLEEIVVTAQKRAESLQDVSVAVSAVNGDRLSDGQIGNAEDLQAIVPNISVGNDFAQAKLFIRGIGLSSSFAGVDPSVALHVDGAVVSQSYAQLGSFFDLERVEVLRGPQGTLYGRNATGGTFNLITRKPTEELEGYGRVTVGNYDKILLEGAISGPISDSIQGRIAFRSDDRSGFGENTRTGADIDDANKRALRGHLNFDVSDTVNLLLSTEWSDEDDAGLGLKFVRESFPGQPFPLSAPGAGGFATDKRDIASEIDYRNDRSTWALNAELSVELNDSWSLKSISNYRDLEVLLLQDLDISSNFNDDVQNNVVESEQLSEELQFIYDDERLHGLVALYYFQEELWNRNNIGFASDNIDTGGFPLFANTQAVLFTGDIDIEALGLFANFTYDITDAVALKLGGRYSRETRDADTLNKLDFSHFGPAATNRTLTFSDKETFTDFSPTVGLDWHLNEDVLLYAVYSEGFKSGAIQGGQLTPITKPETIENFELGLKGTFLDGQLRVNGSAFSYEITDLQQDRTFSTGTAGGFFSLFENAAEAKGEGVELELNWLVNDRFRMDGYVSVLNAEYEDYVTTNNLDASIPAPQIQLKGNSMRQAPELSWSLHGEYEIPLTTGAMLTIGAEAAFKDEQYFTEFNDEVTSADDYTLYSANIKYTSEDQKFFVNLWGKNLTDEEVYSGMFVIATGRTIGGALLPPRTYGLTVGYDF